MINLIYIAGLGRSGSTIVDRILGQVSGLTSLGEMRFIWERSFLQNHLCECQKTIYKCDFWSKIIESTFKNTDQDSFLAIQKRASRLDQTHNIPLLAFKGRGFDTFHQDLEIHTDILSKLYKAISTSSNSDWLIDSSKLPAYGYLLSYIPGIKLHILHLIRDSRAVAYSWRRKKLRPEVTESMSFMRQRSPSLMALRWNYQNLAAQGLSRTSSKYMRVRYEDFMNNPKQELKKILHEFEFTGDSSLNFIDGRSVNLNSAHTVAGNPNRFQNGTIQLILDQEWKEKMLWKDYLKVTTLTSALMKYYGYPHKETF